MFVEVKRKGHKHFGKVFEMSEDHMYNFRHYGSVYGLKDRYGPPTYIMYANRPGDVVRYDPYFYKEYPGR